MHSGQNSTPIVLASSRAYIAEALAKARDLRRELRVLAHEARSLAPVLLELLLLRRDLLRPERATRTQEQERRDRLHGGHALSKEMARWKAGM